MISLAKWMASGLFSAHLRIPSLLSKRRYSDTILIHEFQAGSQLF